MEYGFAKAPIKTASATGTTVTADTIIVAVCRAERATVYQIRWCELRFSFSEAEIGNFALVSAAASEEQANCRIVSSGSLFLLGFNSGSLFYVSFSVLPLSQRQGLIETSVSSALKICFSIKKAKRESFIAIYISLFLPSYFRVI